MHKTSAESWLSLAVLFQRSVGGAWYRKAPSGLPSRQPGGKLLDRLGARRRGRFGDLAKSLVVLAALAFAPASATAAGTWITHPAAAEADTARQPIALQFRKVIRVSARPQRLAVNVSADNRFILYVNGRRVGQGPARGDLSNWRFQRFDIAPYLKAGSNVVAAQVWNDATTAGLSQVTAKTGFMLAAETAGPIDLNTTSGWEVRVDNSRTPTLGRTQISATVGSGFYAAGPPEVLDGAQRDWNWNFDGGTSGDWRPAIAIAAEGAPWRLVADPLPAMAYDARPIGKLVRSVGVNAAGFPDRAVTIPANTTASLLLDAGAVEAAYPELTVSGGKGAEITLHYSEALYDSKKVRFSDRARVDDGLVLGIFDTIKPDGSARRTFGPYWWRVWRFVEVRVKTGDKPLVLEGVRRFHTGYPYQTKARFSSDNPDFDKIWQIGWNTVRVDSHETYQDSSYWEQLQYIGDTRLQALITYAVTADARLPVQAIDAVTASRINGLPRSAYPSRSQQSIPPFALISIGMLHDYWMHQPDLAPVTRNLDSVRTTLDWYSRSLRNGLVGPTPGWQFIDWKPGLSEMTRPNDPPRPDSCVITLFYIGALKQAADLETAAGDAQRASANAQAAVRAADAVRARCWDADRRLFADTPDKTAFSQHANILAVLYDVAPVAEHKALIDRVTVRNKGIEAPTGITGTSYYFSFYLARALQHAGLADRYTELLETWTGLLRQNFTTWPENEDPSRSDTHAWSAHPTADLLGVVAGVQPASPGFRSVRVAPHLGELKRIDAVVAHPSGQIEVGHRLQGGVLRSTIVLPAQVSGSFVWAGRTVPLKSGRNIVQIARTD